MIMMINERIIKYEYIPFPEIVNFYTQKDDIPHLKESKLKEIEKMCSRFNVNEVILYYEKYMQKLLQSNLGFPESYNMDNPAFKNLYELNVEILQKIFSIIILRKKGKTKITPYDIELIAETLRNGRYHTSHNINNAYSLGVVDDPDDLDTNSGRSM